MHVTAAPSSGRHIGRRYSKQPVGEVTTVFGTAPQTGSCLPSILEQSTLSRLVKPWPGQSCHWHPVNSAENALCVLLCARRWRSQMVGNLLQKIRRTGGWGRGESTVLFWVSGVSLMGVPRALGLQLDPSPSERCEAPRLKSRKHRGGVRASRHQDYLLLFIDTAKKKEVQNGG